MRVIVHIFIPGHFPKLAETFFITLCKSLIVLTPNCRMLGINEARKLKSPCSNQLDLILKMTILLHHFLWEGLADPAAPGKGKPAGWAGRTFQPVEGKNIRSCRSSPAPLLYHCIWEHKTITHRIDYFYMICCSDFFID